LQAHEWRQGNSKTRRWEEGRTLVDVLRKASPAAERVAILDTLRQVRWNRRKAQMLGASYKTLLNKIKETGIDLRRPPVG